MQGQVSRRAKTSKEFAGDLRMLDRTQTNHGEMNFHFSSPRISLSVLLPDEIGSGMEGASTKTCAKLYQKNSMRS